jgi:hypothetical protein
MILANAMALCLPLRSCMVISSPVPLDPPARADNVAVPPEHEEPGQAVFNMSIPTRLILQKANQRRHG